MKLSAVNEPSQAVQAMRARAEVCEALMGGTSSMRQAGRIYLPIEPGESDDAWTSRRDKSVLFPALRKVVQTMVGKPLGEPIVPTDIPSEIESRLENVDRGGRDLDTFARAVFERALIDGITWVLVDHTRVPEGASRAEEVAIGAGPYLVHLPLSRVLGWRIEVNEGVPSVVQLRYAECVEVPDGEWGTRLEERVRVWTPGLVQVYKKVRTAKGDEWLEDPSLGGPVTYAGGIPVVPVYTGRTGFWQAKPPLEDLAWLNVAHWQSSSDQRHVLHVARVPLLGADEDLRSNPAAPVAIGPNRLIVGLKGLRFIEHTGAAINAGRQDLLDLEDQMRRVAGELLSRQGGDKTATEAGMEAAEGASSLRAWVWGFQDALEQVLLVMAQWLGLPDGGSLTVCTDWDEEELGFQLIQQLTTARQAGLISQDTYLWNLKRAELLEPDTTIEDEKNRLDGEAPPPMPAAPLAPKAPKKLTATKNPDGTLSVTEEA